MPSALRKHWQELRTLPSTSVRAQQLRAAIRDVISEARHQRMLLDQYLDRWSELDERQAKTRKRPVSPLD